MACYAKPIMEAVPGENQRRGELLQLVAALDRFEPIDPGLVPPESLLHEFIGWASAAMAQGPARPGTGPPPRRGGGPFSAFPVAARPCPSAIPASPGRSTPHTSP